MHIATLKLLPKHGYKSPRNKSTGSRILENSRLVNQTTYCQPHNSHQETLKYHHQHFKHLNHHKKPSPNHLYYSKEPVYRFCDFQESINQFLGFDFLGLYFNHLSTDYGFSRNQSTG